MIDLYVFESYTTGNCRTFLNNTANTQGLAVKHEPIHKRHTHVSRQRCSIRVRGRIYKEYIDLSAFRLKAARVE